MPDPTDPPEPPKPWYAKAGAALPVALTALATAFAGMSTGELQKAMYWRSYAAQDQARATSQWTLAGFKRDRSLACQIAAVQLRAAAGDSANPFERSLSPQAAVWLAGGGPPKAVLPPVEDEHLRDLLAAIESRAPEGELAAKAARVKEAAVTAAVDAAERSVLAAEREWDPTVKAAAELAAAPGKSAAAQAAGFDLEKRRYRLESTLNQGVSHLYEARVHVAGAQSLRHQQKSRQFFYAMLAAQVGATVSALALARQKRSMLWAVAGGTGLVAIAIGGYVYLADG